MTVCLQGGAEFQPGCEAMDGDVLAAATQAGAPRVVVLPLAAPEGRERDAAGANALQWYRTLGASDVQVCRDEARAGEFVERADLVVLPGGSPNRLLEALRPVRGALAALLARGGAVSGASAGAMVLGRWMMPPGRGRGEPVVTDGLALAAVALVLPHYGEQGVSRGRFEALAEVLPPGSIVLGLPERSGVILRPDGVEIDAGVSPVARLKL